MACFPYDLYEIIIENDNITYKRTNYNENFCIIKNISDFDEQCNRLHIYNYEENARRMFILFGL
jgi:hypothetical protein